MKQDKSLSELIGALLITVVIVAGLGLMAVLLLSQSPPVLLPAAEFKLTIDEPYLESEKSLMPKIKISLLRGDPFRIFYDTDEIGRAHV